MGADDLDWKGWLVIAGLIVAFLIMGADKVGPDIVFSVLLTFFVACGVLTVNQAAAGYANSGLLTVIFLYLVSEGIYQTGGLESLVIRLLGRSRSPWWALVRMMIPAMILSAFLNNTPVVALLTPILISWARRSGVPVKKLLMPLSIASVLGGTCTLIGTSTNLVISGAQATRYEKLKKFDDVKFRIFDIAPYGVPYAIWGFLFVIMTQRWLLPGNSSRFARDLLLALRVRRGSASAGKTVLGAKLCSLHGARLLGIFRGGAWIWSPLPDEVLVEGDTLYFSGEFDQVEFCGQELDLELVSHVSEDTAALDDMVLAGAGAASGGTYNKLVQATVSPISPLIGMTIAKAAGNLRALDVAVLGVQRGATRTDGLFNDVTLVAKDVLLLDAGKAAELESTEFTTAFTEIHPLKDGLNKQFIVGFRVLAGTLANKTVSGAGLRGIPGLSALALDRQGDPQQRVEPLDHQAVIQQGDTLWLGADQDGTTFLAKFPGLQLVQQDEVDKLKVPQVYQGMATAVVGARSWLVGQTVAEARFRGKFKAAVIGLQREGVHAPLCAASTVIQAGDVLLLAGHEEWAKKNINDTAFVMLNDVPSSSPPKRNRALVAMFLGLGMVLTQIIPGIMNEDVIHLWPAAVLTAGLMLLSGCLSGDQARRSILWDVYLAIGGAFGVSAAMDTTGVAREFASVFISIAKNIGGQPAALTSIYIATALLSEILTNNASGAIMYPIAAIAGDSLGVEPRAMSVAIMLGASAGFINPFSYQCNMMVYTAGGYRVLEFVKLGVPFQIYLLFVAGVILTFVDHWQTVWIISFAALGGVLGFPLAWAALPARKTVAWELWASSALTRTARLLTPWRKHALLREAQLEDALSMRRHRSAASSDSGEGEGREAKLLERGLPK